MTHDMGWGENLGNGQVHQMENRKGWRAKGMTVNWLLTVQLMYYCTTLLKLTCNFGGPKYNAAKIFFLLYSCSAHTATAEADKPVC